MTTLILIFLLSDAPRRVHPLPDNSTFVRGMWSCPNHAYPVMWRKNPRKEVVEDENPKWEEITALPVMIDSRSELHYWCYPAGVTPGGK